MCSERWTLWFLSPNADFAACSIFLMCFRVPMLILIFSTVLSASQGFVCAERNPTILPIKQVNAAYSSSLACFQVPLMTLSPMPSLAPSQFSGSAERGTFWFLESNWSLLFAVSSPACFCIHLLAQIPLLPHTTSQICVWKEKYPTVCPIKHGQIFLQHIPKACFCVLTLTLIRLPSLTASQVFVCAERGALPFSTNSPLMPATSSTACFRVPLLTLIPMPSFTLSQVCGSAEKENLRSLASNYLVLLVLSSPRSRLFLHHTTIPNSLLSLAASLICICSKTEIIGYIPFNVVSAACSVFPKTACISYQRC